jgi:hypothetical protein
MIYILFLLMFIMIVYFNSHKHENFETTSNIEQTLGEPTREIMSENLEILSDSQFSNVDVYLNDENPFIEGETSGLEKCFNYCNGTCVEFGITGTAMCFP